MTLLVAVANFFCIHKSFLGRHSQRRQQGIYICFVCYIDVRVYPGQIFCTTIFVELYIYLHSKLLRNFVLHANCTLFQLSYELRREFHWDVPEKPC